MPVPVSVTTAVRSAVPSVMVSVAVRAPVALGTNRSCVDQVAPAANVLPEQSSTCMSKSAAFAPVMV